MSAKVHEQFYKHNSWKMSIDALHKLKARAVESDVFVCGNAHNKEEYVPLFDKVFALHLGLGTLKKRIKSRPAKSFGHNPHEMKILEESYAESISYYKDIEAIVIDSSQPIKEVVDSIIAKLKD
jgi:thymidylate kinase